MIGSSIVLMCDGVGELGRVVDLDDGAVGRRDAVEHAGSRGDQLDVELALQPLLDDFHVQQPEEAAAEAEPERQRRLGLEDEGRIVEPQLLERLAQLGVGVALRRVEPGEHHRLHFAEAGERRRRAARRLGDGVADLGVGDVLDAGDEEADFAGAQLVDRQRPRRQDAQRLDLVVLLRDHEADLHARPDGAVDDPDQHDDAAVGVEPGVEDQRLERRVMVALGRRHALDDRLEGVDDADARLGRRQDGVGRVEADDLLDLPLRLVDLRAGQVDLVDHRHDLEVAVDREIRVGQRLRLDALGGVDEQQRAFAGGQRPRHLVREVDVAGRVDQVEDVGLAVLGRVVQAHGVRLDGDAALPLQVHVVEELGLDLARLEGAGGLEETVRQRRLAVVDVRDDREIAYLLKIHCGG